jgi:hypothetical protein
VTVRAALADRRSATPTSSKTQTRAKPALLKLGSVGS